MVDSMDPTFVAREMIWTDSILTDKRGLLWDWDVFNPD